MIKCPACQTAHVDNTIFCGECGDYLLEDNNQATLIGRIPEEYINRLRSGSPFQPSAGLQAIRLQIGAKKREVEVSLDRAIHLGRLAPASDAFPEIDLTNQGTLAKSVSRRHARISKRGNTVVVEDLDSGNGTYINGQKLSPYLPEILSDGDTLQLGQLPIEVEFLMRRGT